MAREEEARGLTTRVRSAREYLTAVRGEFRKITWPTRKETVGGTIGVLAVVAVITVVLGVVDAVLANVVRFILP